MTKGRLIHSISGGDEGFSYMEVVAALAIIFLLSSVIGSNTGQIIQRARVSAARSQIALYRIALDSYFLDTGTLPTVEQGLEALWQRPYLFPVPDNWNGPYIARKSGADPWGNDFVYRRANIYGLPYVLISLGADGAIGGEGNNADITSWE